MNAKHGHNSSFVWCSIHASHVVVRGGLKWRVGDNRNLGCGLILGFTMVVTIL